MSKAKQGDRVRFDFTGTLDDGTVFDTTLEAAECDDECCDDDTCSSDDCGCGGEVGPMELVVGSGEFFAEIEQALVGMAPGEKKTVTVAAADAFGDYDEERVFTINRSELPDDLDPEEGDELVLTDENDESVGVTVIEVTKESITFDSNHPLAGEDLTFEIELREIVPA